MPLYEYQCQKCRETTEVLQKAKDKPLEKCPRCGGGVVKLIVLAGHTVQGQRLVYHRLRQEDRHGRRFQIRRRGQAEGRDQSGLCS